MRDRLAPLLAQLATMPTAERVTEARQLSGPIQRIAGASEYLHGISDALAAIGHTQEIGRRGWRLDFVRPDGRVGWYGEPERNPDRDDPFGLFARAAHARRFTPRAFCVDTAAHPAPVPSCFCGWRLVSDPLELHPEATGTHSTGVRWSWGTGSTGHFGTPEGVGPDGYDSRDNIIERAAIVEVIAIGTTYKIDDTTTTFVCERLERQRIHLIGNRTLAADSVRRLYGEEGVDFHADIDVFKSVFESEIRSPNSRQRGT